MTVARMRSQKEGQGIRGVWPHRTFINSFPLGLGGSWEPHRPRGKIAARDLQEQMNTCSCLTLILASIIFWQVREIERVIADYDLLGKDIELSMLEHVSPIEWENVLLYGGYVIDRDRIQVA